MRRQPVGAPHVYEAGGQSDGLRLREVAGIGLRWAVQHSALGKDHDTGAVCRFRANHDIPMTRQIFGQGGIESDQGAISSQQQNDREVCGTGSDGSVGQCMNSDLRQVSRQKVGHENTPAACECCPPCRRQIGGECPRCGLERDTTPRRPAVAGCRLWVRARRRSARPSRTGYGRLRTGRWVSEIESEGD